MINLDNILIVVAHQDDEVLMFGGIIQGASKVTVVFATGDTERDSETERALCGVTIIPSRGVPPRRINKEEFASKLKKIIREVKPTAIFTHSDKDIHIDHRAVSNVVDILTRPQEYPCTILHGVGVSISEGWNADAPNCFYPLSHDKLKEKINMFDKYKTQHTETRNRRNIKIEAQNNGRYIGAEYAEAYIIRRVVL